jgi:hypothetical protein
MSKGCTNQATLLSPKLLQRHQQILKGHAPSPSVEAGFVGLERVLR